jgi:hypothetical protein
MDLYSNLSAGLSLAGRLERADVPEQGIDDEMFVILQRVVRLGLRNHDFMQLLSGTDADHVQFAFRADGVRQIDDTHAGNLGDEYFAALHHGDAFEDEPDAVLDLEPEPGHVRIGDGQASRRPKLEKRGMTLPRLPITLP